MKVMVLVKASKASEAGEMPSEELMMAMGKYNEQLFDAGIIKAGEGLKPTSEAVRIHISGEARTVTDGPFRQTKELVAGFWIWEVASMQQAIEWAKRCPNPMNDDSDLEIRPIFGIQDFAAIDSTGEVTRQEENLGLRIGLKDAIVQPYLFFGGRCEEALAFYKKSVGATLVMQMRFNESPDPIPDGMLQPGFENKIMHASFMVGATRIMASDGCGDESKFEGFRIALSVTSVEACKVAFNNLANGGNVEMPLTKTFWSPLYGMLTDQFGVGWMVMVAEQNSSGSCSDIDPASIDQSQL